MNTSSSSQAARRPARSPASTDRFRVELLPVGSPKTSPRAAVASAKRSSTPSALTRSSSSLVWSTHRCTRRRIPHNHRPMSETDELLSHNESYAARFGKGALEAPPARRVAVLTCMDARLDPARALGLEEGDAHVIRNAGGVVTDDA